MYHYDENPSDTLMAVGHMPHVHRSIYHALKGRYHHTEAPLPNCPARLREWADARTKAERQALDRVLEECFLLGDDDCWHVPAWDAAILKYQSNRATIAAREEQDKASSAGRVRLLRAERRRLEAALSVSDIGLPKGYLEGLGMRELRALAVQHLGQERVDAIAAEAVAAVAETAGVTPAVTPVKRHEIPNQEPGTGNQQPPHTLNLGEETVGVGGGETMGETAGETPAVTAAETALQGKAVQVMADALTAAGVPAHASHEGLQELVAKGWTASAVLALAPRSWNGINHRLSWLLSKIANQKAPPVGAPAAAQAEEPWTESRKGIEGMGVKLGLGGWSESAWHRGEMSDWPTYRAKVFRAAGVDVRQAA